MYSSKKVNDRTQKSHMSNASPDVFGGVDYYRLLLNTYATQSSAFIDYSQHPIMNKDTAEPTIVSVVKYKPLNAKEWKIIGYGSHRLPKTSTFISIVVAGKNLETSLPQYALDFQTTFNKTAAQEPRMSKKAKLAQFQREVRGINNETEHIYVENPILQELRKFTASDAISPLMKAINMPKTFKSIGFDVLKQITKPDTMSDAHFDTFASIHTLKEKFTTLLDSEEIIYVIARTGSGKTNHIPQYIYNHNQSLADENVEKINCLVISAYPADLLRQAELVNGSLNLMDESCGMIATFESEWYKGKREKDDDNHIVYMTANHFLRGLFLYTEGTWEEYLEQFTHIVIDDVKHEIKCIFNNRYKKWNQTRLLFLHL